MNESNLVDSVENGDISIDQAGSCWFVDLDWYQQSNRSFVALAERRLCPECNERLKAEQGEIAAADLLAAIRDCCSHRPGFITPRLPILEGVFRLFLANNNQPLALEELGKQLRQWLGGDTYRTSPEILYRLLSCDRLLAASLLGNLQIGGELNVATGSYSVTLIRSLF